MQDPYAQEIEGYPSAPIIPRWFSTPFLAEAGEGLIHLAQQPGVSPLALERIPKWTRLLALDRPWTIPGAVRDMCRRVCKYARHYYNARDSSRRHYREYRKARILDILQIPRYDPDLLAASDEAEFAAYTARLQQRTFEPQQIAEDTLEWIGAYHMLRREQTYGYALGAVRVAYDHRAEFDAETGMGAFIANLYPRFLSIAAGADPAAVPCPTGCVTDPYQIQFVPAAKLLVAIVDEAARRARRARAGA